MGNEVSVLVSSAGRRVALIECIRESAAALGLKSRILTVDAKPELSAACSVADESFRAPPADSDEFIGFVEHLIGAFGVRLIIPTIDTELNAYASARARMVAAGAHVNVCDVDVVRIARDKEATAAVLQAAGVPVPRTMLLSRFAMERPAWEFPLLAKPRGGSSSIGIHVLRTIDDLEALSVDRESYIVQPLLSGQEYTINCFVDRSGELKCVVPHRRLEVRGGEVSKGRAEALLIFDDISKIIVKRLPGFRGAFCFQAFVDCQGKACVFEINARFGGGYPLAHRAGARFTTWLLEEAVGLPSTATNDWKPGVTMLRYDAAVFIEAR